MRMKNGFFRMFIAVLLLMTAIEVLGKEFVPPDVELTRKNGGDSADSLKQEVLKLKGQLEKAYEEKNDFTKQFTERKLKNQKEIDRIVKESEQRLRKVQNDFQRSQSELEEMKKQLAAVKTDGLEYYLEFFTKLSQDGVSFLSWSRDTSFSKILHIVKYLKSTEFVSTSTASVPDQFWSSFNRIITQGSDFWERALKTLQEEAHTRVWLPLEKYAAGELKRKKVISKSPIVDYLAHQIRNIVTYCKMNYFIYRSLAVSSLKTLKTSHEIAEDMFDYTAFCVALLLVLLVGPTLLELIWNIVLFIPKVLVKVFQRVVVFLLLLPFRPITRLFKWLRKK
eukprot:snap_masked-scaffold_27-processed-gene-0.26-mRNA-1 protein AED:1.00 eAED:1.00 QI:0/-1/0/0/-1/1/1/0/336